MNRNKLGLVTLITLLAVFATSSSNATVLLADNFDSTDFSAWEHTTNFGGEAAIAATKLNYSSQDYFLSPYLLPDADNRCRTRDPDCWSRASTQFEVFAADDYVLELLARSRRCGDCLVSYDIIVDDELLFSQSAIEFEFQSINLSQLAVGTHTLTLGIRTTAASSGVFQSSFNNVCIATGGSEECFSTARPTPPVSEPGILALLGLGLAGLGFARRSKRI